METYSQVRVVVGKVLTPESICGMRTQENSLEHLERAPMILCVWRSVQMEKQSWVAINVETTTFTYGILTRVNLSGPSQDIQVMSIVWCSVQMARQS